MDCYGSLRLFLPRFKRFKISCGIILLALLFLTSSVEAQTVINDSATITSDITNGIIAGDTDAITPDTLTINTGVTVSNGAGDGIFTTSIYDMTNSGTITGNLEGIDMFNVSSGNVTNSGTITGFTQAGITMRNGDVINSGTITGDANGINTFTRAINMWNGDVTNSGTITAVTGTGINMMDGNVTNSGTIFGDGWGINMDDGNVTNSGIITSDTQQGIFLLNGTVTNSGTITTNSTNNAVQVNTSGSVTNTGTITGNGGVRVVDGTVTNSGTITGNSQAIIIDNNGTVINSGTITGTSGVAIWRLGTSSSGALTLELLPGWVINGKILAGNNTNTFNLTGTGTFNDDFTNWEIFNFNGGSFVMNGIISLTTSTNINGGSLFVNNTLNSNTVTVNSGGTLGGTGTITGNVTNNGAVTPGASIGTLNITGNYTQGAAGNLEIGFDNTQSDVLAASGTATLDGTLTFKPDGAPLLTNKTYTFLTSGTLAGNFSQIVTPAFFTSNVNPVGNDLQVTLTRNSYQSAAITDNHKALGAVFDKALPTATGDLALILTTIDNSSSAGEAQTALDQLSPEPLTASSQTSFSAMQAYTGALVNRLGELRFGGPTTNADLRQALPMFAMGGDDLSQFAQALADSQDKYASLKEWMPFIRTFGVFSDLDQKDSFVGFETQTGGLALGADRIFSERFTVGASLGGAWTNIDYDRDARMDGSIAAFNLAGYVGYTRERWYVDGILSYAFNSFDNERTINFGGIDRVAKSEHDGHEFSTYIGGGYLFKRDTWTYGPTGSMQYIVLVEDGYSESGAGAANLTIDSNTANSFETTLGGRVSRRVERSSGLVLLPEAHANWAHEWAESEHTITAQFTSIAGSSFDVQSRDIGDDSFNLGTGLTAFLKNDIAINLEYETNVGRSDFVTHAITASAKMKF